MRYLYTFLFLIGLPCLADPSYLIRSNISEINSIETNGHIYPLIVLKQKTIDQSQEQWLSSKYPEKGWQTKEMVCGK